MAINDLTAQRVRELLHYDTETGRFAWRVAGRGRPVGRPAGCINGDGYRLITIAGILYPAHRLAWLHATGEWPKQNIDHINGDRWDNRLANLRDTSQRTNRENLRTATANNASGLLGVHWDAFRSKWKAVIYVRGKMTHLGRFDAPADAHAAYLEAKRRLHAGCTI